MSVTAIMTVVITVMNKDVVCDNIRRKTELDSNKVLGILLQGWIQHLIYDKRGFYKYNMRMRNIAAAFWGQGPGRDCAAAGDISLCIYPLGRVRVYTSTDYRAACSCPRLSLLPFVAQEYKSRRGLIFL